MDLSTWDQNSIRDTTALNRERTTHDQANGEVATESEDIVLLLSIYIVLINYTTSSLNIGLAIHNRTTHYSSTEYNVKTAAV
jgi:hypothetical protein